MLLQVRGAGGERLEGAIMCQLRSGTTEVVAPDGQVSDDFSAYSYTYIRPDKFDSQFIIPTRMIFRGIPKIFIIHYGLLLLCLCNLLSRRVSLVGL